MLRLRTSLALLFPPLALLAIGCFEPSMGKAEVKPSDRVTTDAGSDIVFTPGDDDGGSILITPKDAGSDPVDSGTNPTTCDHGVCLFFEDGTASPLAPFTGDCAVSDARAKTGKGSLLCDSQNVSSEADTTGRTFSFDAFIESASGSKSFPFASLEFFNPNGDDSFTVAFEAKFESGDGKLQVSLVSNTTSATKKTLTGLQVNAWHHFDMTYTRSGTKMMFVVKADGTSAGNGTLTDNNNLLKRERLDLTGMLSVGVSFDNVTID